MLKTEYAVTSDIGVKRKTNQDNFYLNGTIRKIEDEKISLLGKSPEEMQIFGVFDGAGGEQEGELASYIATQFLKKHVDLFREIETFPISEMNQAVYQASLKKGRMGTTMAILVLNGDCCYGINLGDSRIYWIRGTKMRCISTDHNEFQELVAAGLYQADDISKNKSKNRLTQWLGMDTSECKISPHIAKLKIKPGDYFLLATDGAYGPVEKMKIWKCITRNGSLKENSQLLTQLAFEAGSTDNGTSLIVRILEV